MTQRYFITGTDTEIGKTYVTCQLAQQLQLQSRSVSCFKPLASGAEWMNGALVNDDALKLQQAASIELSMAQVNPYCFAPAIAPHIAAEQAQVCIDLATIQQTIEAIDTDVALIEGFGGWLAPVAIQQDQTLWQTDIAKALDCEVILVVGMRLGCLNHALLTVKQIERDGLTLRGWIANVMPDGMNCLDENIALLEREMTCPRLTVNHFL